MKLSLILITLISVSCSAPKSSEPSADRSGHGEKENFKNDTQQSPAPSNPQPNSESQTSPASPTSQPPSPNSGENFAGNEIRNGGEGLYCELNGKITVEVWDAVEAREFGLGINIGPGDLLYPLKLALLVERMKKIDLVLGEKLAERMQIWGTKVLFRPASEFELLGDAVHRPLREENCRTVPLAYFSDNGDGDISDLQYRVNRTYWAYLSEDDRAVLILHETLYGVYKEVYGVRDSDTVRKIVARLISES